RHHVGKRNLPAQVSDCSTKRRSIASDIPHIPNQRPNNFHEDVRPRALVERALIVDPRESLIKRLEDLPMEHFGWNRRQVDGELKDFFQVIAAGNTLLAERLLDAETIKGDYVNDLRKAGG